MIKGYYKINDQGYEIHGDPITGLLKAINDINNRLVDIEEWHRNVFDTGFGDQSILTILNNKVKDLEREKQYTVNDPLGHDKRIKDLEGKIRLDKTWQDLTVSRLDTNWSRIEKLEGKLDTLVSESINEDMNLRGRVEHLEKEDNLKDDNLHSLYWQVKELESSWGNLFSKLKELEEWKDKRYQNIEHQNNRIFEIEKKVKNIEELKQDIEREISWRKLYCDGNKAPESHKCHCVCCEHDGSKTPLAQKVKDLEEWKQRHISGHGTHDEITIDKKAWEHIKYLIEMMDDNWYAPDETRRWLSEIMDAIKKID